MEIKTIADLKSLFKTGKITKDLIARLKTDERIGVQKLIKAYESKQQTERKLEKQFLEMGLYEQKGYETGAQHIAGIDEAGRGPLAGPVIAAAVILPRKFRLLGLTDSKQITKSKRNEFFKVITEQAISYGISIISSQEIDRINIYEATKKAMNNALNQLKPMADHVLIDAVSLEGLPCPSESIIKGDQKSITIAAASILAKVTRDQLMYDVHTEYPIYDFMSNMGYGTKHHLQMLSKYGASPYHRKTFAPVRKVINR